MVENPDAGLAGLKAEAEELFAKQARAKEQLAQIRGRGSGWNGHVVVEVDAGGKFLGVRLNSQAGDLRVEDLEGVINAAARAAQQDAAAKAQEALAELMSDPRVAGVMEDIGLLNDKAFPGAKTPPPAPAAPEIDDEEWNDASAWLRKA